MAAGGAAHTWTDVVGEEEHLETAALVVVVTAECWLGRGWGRTTVLC